MGYILFFVIVLASLFIVDSLAHKRGWNRSRWTLVAVVLGPLAIPLIYLADAVYAVRKMITAHRT